MFFVKLAHLGCPTQTILLIDFWVKSFNFVSDWCHKFCPTIAPRLPKQSPIWERFLRQFLLLYYRKEFLEWSDSILVLMQLNFCGSRATRLHKKCSFEWSWRGCKSSGNQESLETILFQPYFTKSNQILRWNGHMVVFAMISIQQDRTISNGSRAPKSIISLIWSIWSN